ncbi:MAG: selenocysteine-specific translation elongation factor [Chloroflexota bacterium]
MKVIGTAGHVDHGKSTLVQALTGTHPDRLKEEREREMTIDLGFAWLTLDGEEIGIVDVPGHRDFIENMLAGVGSIDAALFVIAADEGVMPQTREHLAILDLLQVQGGVIALTKVDMLEDPEWLDLIEEDVRRTLAGTILADVPLVRVSARTGEGIPDLKDALVACLANRPPRPDLRRPRLPVDRVFTMPGFGTIVTGTLNDGRLQVGDEVEILPAGWRGRVRGLQTHKQKETEAIPGGRTAVNVSGVGLEQVQRGDVIAHPGTYRPTGRMDVRFRLLGEASQPLHHNDQVKFFIGAAEVVARVRLLGVETLRPGEEGWLQLELTRPVVAVRGDRYILRRPSPGETLGGGSVVDPAPKGRHKRFAAEVLTRLEALAQGTPAEVLQQALVALGLASLQDALTRSNLDQAAAQAALAELIATGQIVNVERGDENIRNADLVAARVTWERLSARALEEVAAYHKAYPLRAGLPREELRSRLSKGTPALPPRLFPAVYARLVADGRLAEDGPQVKLPGHRVQFTPQQQARADALLAKFAAAPFAPPSAKECQAEAGEEIFTGLVETGRLVAVSPEVVFRREDYRSMQEQVLGLIAQQGVVSAAEVRDHFNTSRRYVLALLEHFDAIGLTLRDGDVRRKGRKAS